jgi:hypothetical protein
MKCLACGNEIEKDKPHRCFNPHRVIRKIRLDKNKGK